MSFFSERYVKPNKKDHYEVLLVYPVNEQKRDWSHVLAPKMEVIHVNQIEPKPEVFIVFLTNTLLWRQWNDVL
jgi:hypothetical protein